jgi:hypothetical protein
MQSLLDHEQPSCHRCYFYVGNLPLMPGVFPDCPAPVVRNVGDDRGMVMMQWGCRHRRVQVAHVLI